MDDCSLNSVRIISPTCIGIATALGGPAAGAMLFGCNSVLAKRSVMRAMIQVIGGMLVSAFLVSAVVVCQISIPVVGMTFVAMGAAATRWCEWCHRRSGQADGLRPSRDGMSGQEPISGWVVVPAVLVGAVVNGMVALPLVMPV